MTWFKKRQPRLPLLIWGALIPDGAFSLLLVFKPGKDSIHLQSCFFSQIGQANTKILLTPKFFRCNTYKLLSSLDATLTKNRGWSLLPIWSSFPPTGLGARLNPVAEKQCQLATGLRQRARWE